MRITVKGGSSNQKKRIISIVQFCASTLMPRIKNLDITVRLKDLSKQNVYGYCTADPEGDAERLDRPRVFDLEIHSKMKLRKILETVAHEMVHVKQFAKGELYQSSRNSKHRWQGQWVNKDPDYWDCPWEIEAFGRQPGLFLRWVAKNNYQKKKWTKLS